MKKALALILAFVLVIGASVAGTLAYLTAETDAVVNTFTVGKVDITLIEHDKDDRTTVVEGNDYPLIPGKEYFKDPHVTVVDTSEDCWLFVKFEEPNPKPEWLVYTSLLNTDQDWTQGDGTNIPANVWYRSVMKNAATKDWSLLSGNKISIDGEKLTKDNMPAESATPELKYTAYACQLAGFEADPAGAWAKVSQ